MLVTVLLLAGSCIVSTRKKGILIQRDSTDNLPIVQQFKNPSVNPNLWCAKIANSVFLEHKIDDSTIKGQIFHVSLPSPPST